MSQRFKVSFGMQLLAEECTSYCDLRGWGKASPIAAAPITPVALPPGAASISSHLRPDEFTIDGGHQEVDILMAHPVSCRGR